MKKALVGVLAISFLSVGLSRHMNPEPVLETQETDYQVQETYQNNGGYSVVDVFGGEGAGAGAASGAMTPEITPDILEEPTVEEPEEEPTVEEEVEEVEEAPVEVPVEVVTKVESAVETPKTTEVTPEPPVEVTQSTQPNVIGSPEYPYASDSPIPVATPATSRVQINGKTINFGAYEINGFNYYKLTDLAYALTGTNDQFMVTWQASKSAVNLLVGQPHVYTGTELRGNSGKTEYPYPNYTPIYQNDQEIWATCYVINGESFVKLDDLRMALDLNVSWNHMTSTISINT